MCVRFTLVQKTGSPCSSLAFALHRRSEFLVGMADCSLKCFDAGRLLFCLCEEDFEDYDGVVCVMFYVIVNSYLYVVIF